MDVEPWVGENIKLVVGRFVSRRTMKSSHIKSGDGVEVSAVRPMHHHHSREVVLRGGQATGCASTFERGVFVASIIGVL